MTKIQQLLESETKPHPAVKFQLEQRQDMTCLDDCKLASPEVAVIASTFNDYSSGGGVARHSVLQVIYKDENEIKRWQYCDKYSSARDRRELMINSLGKIEVTETDTEVKVVVECIPPTQYSSRFVTYTFQRKDDSLIHTPVKLSEEAQKEFERWVEEERTRIYNRILEIWEKNTHTMPSPHGRLPYIQPSIKDLKLNKIFGIGVIVAEEQIDFSPVGDPQMQQKAFLLMWEGKKIHLALEKHAYTTEDSATIKIVDISPRSLTLGTLGFNKTLFYENLPKASD